MTRQTTKEQALDVLRQITAAHSQEPYFKSAEVVSHDVGYGVDLWVDGSKWRERSFRTPVQPIVDHVPICILLVG